MVSWYMSIWSNWNVWWSILSNVIMLSSYPHSLNSNTTLCNFYWLHLLLTILLHILISSLNNLKHKISNINFVILLYNIIRILLCRLSQGWLFFRSLIVYHLVLIYCFIWISIDWLFFLILIFLVSFRTLSYPSVWFFLFSFTFTLSSLSRILKIEVRI